jgi:serine-type D-Ala-D-Ala carboxypeptidase/endopeptidase
MTANGLRSVIRAVAVAAAASSAVFVGGERLAAQDTVPEAAIREILADRVDVQRQAVGIVVGIVTPEGRRVIAYGRSGNELNPSLTADTVFPIASVTKVFTALLLADMVQRGEVDLMEPLARLLPATVRIPERQGQSIRLVDLATHTSGLPARPADLPAATDVARAEYSIDRLHRFVSSYDLPRDIGTRWDYGNVDYALLGDALARRANSGFEALLTTRIADPLRLESTGVGPHQPSAAARAVGYDMQMQPIERVEAPGLAPSGALHSTASDLMAFLAASMGLVETRLAPAMASMLATRRPMPGGDSAQQALGWFVTGQDGEQMVFHDGTMPGFSAAIAYRPRHRIGVVVLANSSRRVGDLARHILRPAAFPLARVVAPPARAEIAVEPERLTVFAGRYQLASGAVMIVTRDDRSLLFSSQSTGTISLRPVAERSFSAREIDLGLTFQVDDAGRVTSLILEQGERKTLARRTPP